MSSTEAHGLISMHLTEFDLSLQDGRTLHAYDTGTDDDTDRLVVVWHHGTPNIGAPPAPLFATSERLGIRWVSYDRPGYGGSTPRESRSVASAAGDAASVVDALGIDQFAVMGHSGGASHALACAALLGDRVVGAISVSGMAPFGADGLDWFAGMSDPTMRALRAATAGRVAKEQCEATATDADPGFIPADHAVLAGDWSWFHSVVRPALEGGPGGLIDDDLAHVLEWGFEPADIGTPTLFLHGADDRVIPCSHSEWLAARCASADLRVVPGEGHISVLNSASAALEWLRATTA